MSEFQIGDKVKWTVYNLFGIEDMQRTAHGTVLDIMGKFAEVMHDQRHRSTVLIAKLTLVDPPQTDSVAALEECREARLQELEDASPFASVASDYEEMLLLWAGDMGGVEL